ncbi:MAG: hypothetical protein WC374_13845 [Phycisphaerae bacterium]|jgi:hypothetical protein
MTTGTKEWADKNGKASVVTQIRWIVSRYVFSLAATLVKFRKDAAATAGASNFNSHIKTMPSLSPMPAVKIFAFPTDRIIFEKFSAATTSTFDDWIWRSRQATLATWRAVENFMGGDRASESKITQFVMLPVLVFVMHYLAFAKWATKMITHHKPMLINKPCAFVGVGMGGCINFDVSVAGNSSQFIWHFLSPNNIQSL